MIPESARAAFNDMVVCVSPGRSAGTGFWVGCSTILTSHHTIGDASEFSIDGRPYKRDALIFEDPVKDLALVQTMESKEIWLIPGEEVEIGTQCWFVTKVDNSIETGLIRDAGYRQNLDHIESKFDAGQIWRGCSGAPIINLDTAMLVGVIHESANTRSALGGWGSPASEIAEIRKRLQLDTDDDRCLTHWEAVVAQGGPPITDTVGAVSPYKHWPCFGFDTEIDALAAAVKPGWVGFVTGRAGSGKSTLATAWMYRVRSRFFAKRI